ncbi:RHS repeat-associated core domain-containing protein [Salmonella enterica]|nr:RHS repeat-associated core domain-containing protein [Salmonella enterica]
MYHYDLPLALISPDNTVAWRAEYDDWGNLLSEENPEHLEQLIRLPGQQYDEESGLHYNRHRYYNPGQGRYITQDPIGLAGGWNLYTYPLNPIVNIDPLGLTLSDIPNYKFNSQDEAALFAIKMCNSTSIAESREYGGLVCKTSNNKYIATEAKQGSLAGFSPSNSSCPFGATKVGDYHTHGFYSDLKGNPVSPQNDAYDSLHFSPQDISGITSDGIGNPDYTGYLGTPDNKYYKFTPGTGKTEEMKYVILTFIFLIPLRCMSEKLVFLDEVQTKTMNVAFSHFREHTNWGLFNTMIQDDNENIKIAFYCKSHPEENRGGGMEQIIYIISKKDFKIKKINKSYSK